MTYQIFMGEPEIRQLWDSLLAGKKLGRLTATEDEFFEKWVKAINLLAGNPRHPGLQTHEIDTLTTKFGIKIFESYLENRTPNARRIFWAYGPQRGEITILAIENHPNPNKKHAFKQIRLSRFPKK